MSSDTDNPRTTAPTRPARAAAAQRPDPPRPDTQRPDPRRPEPAHRSTAHQPEAHSAPADAHDLVRQLGPALRDWLPGQRWFAGKGAPITAATPLATARLDSALHHLLVRVEQPGRTPETYQLLLATDADRDAPRDLPEQAVVGRFPDGRLVYDALYGPAHADRLLALLLARAALPDGLTAGQLPSGPAPVRTGAAPTGAAPTGAGPLTPRVITAEQSNTSVVYGDRMILKLFRRVSPGTNPDLELTRALAAAGSTRVPAPLAWLETAPADPEPPATLALLQQFLGGGRDGWELALSRAAELLPDAADTPVSGGAGTGNFAAESFLLGRATAEVHLTLARVLPCAVLGPAEADALTTAMTDRLNAAADAVPALREYRSALVGIYRDLQRRLRGGSPLRVQRIHGDLHLGQSMRTGRGWVLLDFEGEPAAPLAERRRLHPAARDVAAMLRSYDYAASHRLLGGETRPEPEAEQRAARWSARNREAYCAGYAAAGGLDPRADPVLLRAFETDKAVYEVVYEARNRPAWLPIPLAAVRRLTAAASGAPAPDSPTGAVG
jgi:maltokinase